MPLHGLHKCQQHLSCSLCPTIVAIQYFKTLPQKLHKIPTWIQLLPECKMILIILIIIIIIIIIVIIIVIIIIATTTTETKCAREISVLETHHNVPPQSLGSLIIYPWYSLGKNEFNCKIVLTLELQEKIITYSSSSVACEHPIPPFKKIGERDRLFGGEGADVHRLFKWWTHDFRFYGRCFLMIKWTN